MAQKEPARAGMAAWPLAALGAVAAVAGVVVGLLPVAATGGGTCGSPFMPATHGFGEAANLVGVWCADDLGTRLGWAWVLIAAGALLLAASAIMAAGRSRLLRQNPRQATVAMQ